MQKRCPWPTIENAIAYHDTEWGVPLHEDRKHFEFIVLDTFQAGLSWQIILNKREGFRAAFVNFDPVKIATWGDKDVARLKDDAGIIRNEQKIRATIKNANAFIAVQEEFGSFDKYIWQFTGGKTIQNKWTTDDKIPAITPEAEAMSADLKKRGFSFVGPTTCYAYMQAAGMVNDHLTSCFRYSEIAKP